MLSLASPLSGQLKRAISGSCSHSVYPRAVGGVPVGRCPRWVFTGSSPGARGPSSMFDPRPRTPASFYPKALRQPSPLAPLLGDVQDRVEHLQIGHADIATLSREALDACGHSRLLLVGTASARVHPRARGPDRGCRLLWREWRRFAAASSASRARRVGLSRGDLKGGGWRVRPSRSRRRSGRVRRLPSRPVRTRRSRRRPARCPRTGCTAPS